VLSVLRLRVRRGAGRSVDPLRRDKGGDEVRPDVCRNMENRVDAVRKEGQGILGHEQPNQGKDCNVELARSASYWGKSLVLQLWTSYGRHTKILDVLIPKIVLNSSSLDAGLLASPPCLVDHYSIRGGRGDEGETIAKPGHSAIIIEADPGERISEDTKEQKSMSGKMVGSVELWKSCPSSFTYPENQATTIAISVSCRYR